MGKKKNQQHLQQSMGQMVSKAALAQMGPSIERFINSKIQQLGSQLAMKSADTLETMFSRIVVLETILIEKLGITQDDLADRVSKLEDEKEGFALVAADEAVKEKDLVRIEISTRKKEQPDWQGTSRLKVYEVGSGQYLGPELETPIIGMKTGETKDGIEFGDDKGMVAKITLNRVSRAIPQEPSKEEATAPEVNETAKTEETQGADQSPG